MKKFILCVALGYLLVYLIFIGLPQMMGRGRQQTLFPKDTALPASIRRDQPAAETQTGNSEGAKSAGPVIPAERIQKDKTLEKQNKTGPVETFYRNGTLSSEWLAQEPGEGTFKTYTSEGRPWMEIPFRQQRPEGEVKTFYAEGPLFSSVAYAGGEKNGKESWFYETGQAWLEMSFKPASPLKLEALYSADGSRADQPAVRAEQDSGYFKAYDEQGHEVVNWQQAGGEQNTILKSYYQSGKVSSEWSFKNNVLHGRAARYYPDGALWMETEFIEGQVSSRTAYYRPDGSLLMEQNSVTTPSAGEETTAYYPGGKTFWVLTAAYEEGAPPVFHLKTYWQADGSEKKKKENKLL